MSTRQSLVLIVVVSAALRLLVAGGTGFGVDEAYAVTVARPFSLSYFDHPPLHFWIAGVVTALRGDMAPFWTRLPFVGLFCITLAAIGGLTARLFGPRASVYAVFALASSGVLGVAAGSWVLPDGPLIAATSIAAWLLAPVLLADDVEPASRAVRWRWIGAGVAFGLGALSKYHAVLTAAGILLFLCTDQRARRWLRTRWPWIAACLLSLGMLPAIWWNARNEWVSFAFQSGRARAAVWSAAPFFESLGGQLLWLLPWIGIPLALAAWHAIRSATGDRRRWLCLCLAAPPIVVFTGLTLGGARGLPHWQAPGWLFAFPLLGAWCDESLRRGARWPLTWRVGSGLATTLLLVALLLHVRTDLLDRLVSPSVRDGDPSRDVVSWRPAVDVAMRVANGDSLVFAARSWIQAGQIGVAIDGRPSRVICVCEDPHHFAWRDTTVAGARVVLLDRVQRHRRGWVAADSAPRVDALRLRARDTVQLARGVQVVLYDVTLGGQTSTTNRSAATH